MHYKHLVLIISMFSNIWGANADLQWVSSHVGRQIPANAVVGGWDKDGSTLYVGKAPHAGGMLIAKVKSGAAYVANNHDEHEVDSYEILVGNGVKWVRDSNGHVPQNAVVGGYNRAGETLYIGRAPHSGSLIPGKIVPSLRGIYVPYRHDEHKYSVYEVLVTN